MRRAVIQRATRAPACATGRTVYYTYRTSGHVAHITIKDEGQDIVKDLYLAYGTDEKMGVAIAEEWRYDPNDPNRPWTSSFTPDPNDPNQADKVTVAIEFRYESGRRRHLLRSWDTHGRTQTQYWTVSDATWTDYIGDEPYVDYTVAGDQSVATEHVRWLAGLGIRGREGVGEGDPPTRFMHADLTGSTMLETGPAGEVESSGGWEDSGLWQYTAFGEQIWPLPEGGIQRTADSGRSKYCGLYGYESGMFFLWGANEDLPPITLTHVGERWYQPGIGRFIQRDPIELRAGLNGYAYVRNRPIHLVDPQGLIPEWVKGVGVVAVVVSIAILVPPTILGLVGGCVGMTGTCLWGADELGALGEEIGESDPPPWVPPGTSFWPWWL